MQNRDNGNVDSGTDGLPVSRSIPRHASLTEQTVRSMESLLVGTGVFNPDEEKSDSDDDVYHGHRDIHNEPELAKPSRYARIVIVSVICSRFIDISWANEFSFLTL